MSTVRPASVAGTFYPANRDALFADVTGLLERAEPAAVDIEPRALIVPHAGYVYSGTIAAAGYALLQRTLPERRRIVLVGPSHFVAFSGLATAGVEAFHTPLGLVPVDDELTKLVLQQSTTSASVDAHHREHSLEVQLPFLQVAVGAFNVLPLVTGDVSARETAEVLDDLLDEPSVLAVVSSDLSHYLDYATAVERDDATAGAVASFRWEDIGPADACGRIAIQAMLIAASRRGWGCQLLAAANSADTAGSPDRVVGYAAFVLGPSQ